MGAPRTRTPETVEPPALSLLSPRELDALRLASRGSTNREISARLGISVHAVKFRLASAYRKLGVANRTQAAAALLTADRGGSHGGARKESR